MVYRQISKEVAKLIDEKKIPVVFKAFCDINRIQILKQLLTGEKCACVLLEQLHISQPTLSHHMKILCSSGIVVMRKEQKWAHYSISEEGVAIAIEYLQSLMTIKSSSKDKSCCDR